MADPKTVSDDGRDVVNPNPKSYALLEEDTKGLYLNFYRHTYAKGVLDRKTMELVAIGAALVSGCQHCLEGHLKKAIKSGASRAEISETIAIALGVSAATIVDRSDIASENLKLWKDAEGKLHYED